MFTSNAFSTVTLNDWCYALRIPILITLNKQIKGRFVRRPWLLLRTLPNRLPTICTWTCLGCCHYQQPRCVYQFGIETNRVRTLIIVVCNLHSDTSMNQWSVHQPLFLKQNKALSQGDQQAFDLINGINVSLVNSVTQRGLSIFP